jgi:hypothetical protein
MENRGTKRNVVQILYLNKTLPHLVLDHVLSRQAHIGTEMYAIMISDLGIHRDK